MSAEKKFFDVFLRYHPTEDKVALLERAFSSISLSLGKTFLKGRLPSGVFPQMQTGVCGGHSHPLQYFAKLFLTILSSREWKVIIATLPLSERE